MLGKIIIYIFAVVAHADEFNWGVTELGGEALAASFTKNTEIPFNMATSTKEVEASRQILSSNSLRKIKERHGWLSDAHSEGSHFRHNTKNSEVWALFQNTAACPWTLDKNPPVEIRHDGGKWICGLPELGVAKRSGNSGCVVYSVGSHRDTAFEAEVRRQTECEIHIFDPTSRPLDVGPGSMFHSLGVSGETNTGAKLGPMMTLQDIASRLHHKNVDILKIDVEGSEFETFASFFGGSGESLVPPVRIGQILVEVHPRKIGAASINEMWDYLERAGFRQFSIEPVSKNGGAQVEVGFLHQDWTPDGWRK